MWNLHSLQADLIVFSAGVALHILFFRHGEWDLWATKLVGAFLTLQASLLAYLTIFERLKVATSTSAIKTVTLLGTSLVVGIVTSMLVYRKFFHRLHNFPGPTLAPLSNFYATYLSAKKLHLYEETEKLHHEYGDFVRLGPTELSIIHPKAVTAIYASSSPCSKGPWYNILHPRVSLQMIRNKAEHARRRKVWDRGFSSKALRDYEFRVSGYTDQLLAKIEESRGKPLNMSDWFNFYSFDVMGDLSFGKSFGMLKEGEKHYFMKSLHADMTYIGLLGRIPWLFPFVKITPGINYEHLQFWKWLAVQVQERQLMNPDRPDVFSWLLEEYDASTPHTKQQKLDLEGDAYLIVVAGSDTTAASLSSLFFHLAQEPLQVKSLRKEIDEYFEEVSQVDSTGLSKLTYLNAIINEALRLHPPVPSGTQRVTPAEGLTIGDTFIPGNTTVQVPLHSVFRDERNFAEPNEFLPERWTTRPELVKNASTFAPFLLGTYGCIGKQLALMEMRYVVSQIIHRYDVDFAPDQTAKAFLDGKRDTFTLALGPLGLTFTPRKK